MSDKNSYVVTKTQELVVYAKSAQEARHKAEIFLQLFPKDKTVMTNVTVEKQR